MKSAQKYHFDFWGFLDDGPTKLVKAIANNDVRSFKKYIDQVSLNDYHFGPGWTLLHYASIMGRQEIIAVILAHKADVDTLTSLNESPLFMAVRHKHIDAAKQLLMGHADPRKAAMNVEIYGKYYKQITPLQLAKVLGNQAMVKLIKKYLKTYKPKPMAVIFEQDKAQQSVSFNAVNVDRTLKQDDNKTRPKLAKVR